MKSRHLPWIAFAVLAVCQIGQTAYYLSYLPASVAVHFDPAGRPNGWSSSAGVLTIAAVETAIMAAIFAVAGLFRFTPVRIINVPNKGYWLAPERREAAFAFLRDWLRWVVVLTLAFLSAVHGAALRANLTTPPHLAPIWNWLVVPFAIAVVAMIMAPIRRFRRPREET
jgi:hypothetical protein